MYKNWCFTENNEAETFYANLQQLSEQQAGIKYICGQLERASTGQLHFQGYVQLVRNQRLSYVKNRISATAHFEQQRGTNDQARDYCKKTDTAEEGFPFIEFGRYTKSAGQRNDLIALRDEIIKGTSQREIIEKEELVETFAKHLKFADRVRSLYKPKKDISEFQVTLYYGDPRSGKTRRAYEEYPDLYEVPITTSNLWLDGYDGHKVALLDDFAGKMSKISLTNTLKLLDRYVRQVPIKGAHVWWMPDHIIITTNIHPRAWYDWSTGNREVHWDALRQRFTKVVVFENGTQEEIEVQEFMQDTDLWPTIENTDQYFPA